MPPDFLPSTAVAALVAMAAMAWLGLLPALAIRDRFCFRLFAAGLVLGFSFSELAQARNGPLAWLFAGGLTLALFAALALIVWPGSRFEGRQRSHLALGLATLMGAFLGYASGDAGGPDSMVQWFQATFGMTREQADVATIAFRKTVHFTYFGILASLALSAGRRLQAAPSRAVLFALLWAATFAAYDEVRQLASPARTGSAMDFVLDMLGAATFVWIATRSSRNSTSKGPAT